MRQSRSRTSEYLTQRRKAAKAGHLSFRPKGEILLRSLAVTRDDGLARSISVLGERNIRIQKFALYAHILSESYFDRAVISAYSAFGGEHLRFASGNSIVDGAEDEK